MIRLLCRPGIKAQAAWSRPVTNHDRWFFIQLNRWFPLILQVLTIVRPETLVRSNRASFRCYWRWKSRPSRRISMENPLWGAPLPTATIRLLLGATLIFHATSHRTLWKKLDERPLSARRGHPEPVGC